MNKNTDPKGLNNAKVNVGHLGDESGLRIGGTGLNRLIVKTYWEGGGPPAFHMLGN